MATAISSELTCPICLELFKDPVTLAKCMHSYCRQCLQSILKSSGGKRLHCPECRAEEIMSHKDLQKMPRNFTIANIVAKYEKVDKAPKIPCDLCDEKPPSNAVKSCKECKISYCSQCLFLHPKRGVLATHTLVDPQVCNTEETKQPLEKFCMKCVLILKYEDDKEYCQHDHPTDVMDTDVAKAKIMNYLIDSFVRLEERDKKYAKELKTTEKLLGDVKLNEKKTKETIKAEMNKKYTETTNKTKSDFKHKMDGLQEFFEKETETIKDEFERWTKEARERNVQYMRQLETALASVTAVIAEMQSIFAAQKDRTEIDIKDLMRVYLNVKETEKNKNPRINSYKDFHLSERLENVTFHKSVSLKPKQQINQSGRVMITSCTPNLRKLGDGASITLNWSSTKHFALFRIQFVDVTNDGYNTIITVHGIRGQQYTEDRLQPNTTYDVTVSGQDDQSSESECKRVCTLSGVSCDEFKFSSTMKHVRISLSWDNKSAKYGMQLYHQEASSYCLITKVWVVAGTLLLRNSSQYWECMVTYNLRGIGKGSYAAALGICVKDKVEAVQRIATNCFFYGVAFGKDKKGLPEIICIEAGFERQRISMKSEQNYILKVGFYFDSCLRRLVMIDVTTDSILYITEQFKEGLDFEYLPISDWDKKGDANIELITGSSIRNIPSCLQLL